MISLFNLPEDLTEKQAKCVFVIFLIALGLAGDAEYQSEIEAQTHYANLVCEGHVPDYKELKPEC
jgi:FPC/CPF motif-containing protein YcgG